jgi:hypothetical protein
MPTRKDLQKRLNSEERDDLVEDLIRGLEERGLPPGAWLVDIGAVRHALRDADALLRRLEQAIIRSASSSPFDGR